MKKQKKDALVKVNPLAMDTKKAGTSLTNAAEEMYRQKKQEVLVNATASIMKQMEDARISRDWCNHVVDFLEDKLEALKAGTWHYDNLHNMIVFNRADLNNTQPEKHRPDNVRGLGGRL
jgi:hypothetical protein